MSMIVSGMTQKESTQTGGEERGTEQTNIQSLEQTQRYSFRQSIGEVFCVLRRGEPQLEAVLHSPTEAQRGIYFSPFEW